MSLQYDEYLKEHIQNVTNGLRWMNDNLDLKKLGIIESDIYAALENAEVHDRSKFDPVEYRAYDDYFYGGNKSHAVKTAFDQSWLHHQHVNPHHWQYWVLVNDDDGVNKALPMPEDYILEMIADWWSFSWKEGNLMKIFDWYDKHKDVILFEEETRKTVESILAEMRKVLEMQQKHEKGYIGEAEEDYLEHHGILGQRWGVRRYQNADGSLTEEGKKRYHKTVFVSGSSKTQSEDSPYYRKDLPNGIRKELDKHMEKHDRILVGDAPGIDRQVQDYLNEKEYDAVEVYGPGKQVRYSANSSWKTNPIDAPEFEEGSKEWLAKKDITMAKEADEGLAVILDEGAKATRKNVQRMRDDDKDVKVYMLDQNGLDLDRWLTQRELKDVIIHSDMEEDEHQYGIPEHKKFPLHASTQVIGKVVDTRETENGLEVTVEHSEPEDDEDLYGVPELKKFPMPDKKHVKSAIRFFNYVDQKHEKELAKAILEKMDKYGMSFDDFGVGDENRFKKYIPEEDLKKNEEKSK